MKKTIDIEKLLQWAFREELPKGRPVSTSPWDLVARFGDLGTRIDGAGPGDGLGFVQGAPHPDAEIVGAAVASLDAETWIEPEDCSAMLGHLADCDPLAALNVTRAPYSMRALVIRCAVLGTRMEWDLGTPELHRVTYSTNQRPIIFGLDPDGRLREVKADRHGRYPPDRTMLRCHLRLADPSVAQIAEARAEYTVWRRALTKLHARLLLDYELAEHVVLSPKAAPEPWVTGESDEDARVLASKQVAADLSVLPVAPKRQPVGPALESDIERKSRQWRNPALRLKVKDRPVSSAF